MPLLLDCPRNPFRLASLTRWELVSMLYLTAFVTVAALVYLVYAMLRPERF